MKTLKINQLEKNTLDAHAMSQVKGGALDYCGCSCAYAGNGGSSIESNGRANALGGGLKSPQGDYKDVTYILDEVVVTP